MMHDKIISDKRKDEADITLRNKYYERKLKYIRSVENVHAAKINRSVNEVFEG